MMFDFDAAERALRAESAAAKAADDATLTRAVELESDLHRWVMENGSNCGVDRKKLHVELVVSGYKTMKIDVMPDGSYSVSYSLDEDGEALPGITKDEMMRTAVIWYRNLF